MILNYYKKINKIPLTSSGKLNRILLPEPSLIDKIKDIYKALKINIEKTLCRINSEIFNIDENKIGITDDFFDLGGTGLIAIRIITKIHREFNINMKIKEIMKFKTIESLSIYINEFINDKNDVTKINHTMIIC
ncbi:hypothetical protein PIROE2DRAFT_1204 [Piromyces sp. E2]|nr:hypothetical protein PIROE2DRAFT_1204 [Piromyces sp. E2]|eukprot:OUM70664.1 hypothetical protein PIROE2DRAFT_1204 [Piromyces sp. E2]